VHKGTYTPFTELAKATALFYKAQQASPRTCIMFEPDLIVVRVCSNAQTSLEPPARSTIRTSKPLFLVELLT